VRESLRQSSRAGERKLAKTDKIDAETIAHFGQSLQPPVTLLPDAQTKELQA
jgi:transposase